MIYIDLPGMGLTKNYNDISSSDDMKQDSSVGYKDAINIMDCYPRGSFAILDIAGHNLQIEQPQLFSSLVNEWLDRTEEIL